MPLVNCVDCGREVSTLASSCPQCGRPMMPATNASVPEPVQEQTIWRGTPSPMLLAGHLAGIAAVLIAATLFSLLSRSAAAQGEGGRDLTLFVWLVASIVLLIQVVALLVAWIRLRSTQYTVSNQRVLIEQGIFTKTLNEIDLRYIDDSLFVQTFVERMLGIGNVTLVSSDSTTPQFVLRAIGAPRTVREMIRTEAYKASQRQLFTRAT